MAAGERATRGTEAQGTTGTGWSRRRFLTRSGTAAGVLAVAGVAACGADDNEDDVGTEVDPEDWSTVRDQFELSPDHRVFDAWALGVHARPVEEAIERYRQELQTTPWRARETGPERELAIRRKLAWLIGADASEIALTGGRAQALGFLYGGIRLGFGDEIITIEHDYLTAEAVRLVGLRGAVVRSVALYDSPTEVSSDRMAERMVDRLVEQLSGRTRVVALPWVLSDTGLRLPVADLVEALGFVNAAAEPEERILLCVDAGYGLGVNPVAVEELGCDFLVGGMDHWMFGPRGTGFCWGSEAAWRRFAPSAPGLAPPMTEAWVAGDDLPTTMTGAWATPAGAGPEHRWAMGAAVDFLREVGVDEVSDHTLDQAAALKEGLAEIDAVTVITPSDPERSSGLVSFRPETQDPYQLVEDLRHRFIIADVAPFDPRLVRLGPSMVTDPDDVEALLSALHDLA